MIADKACYERGCACYDHRDGDGVEVVKKQEQDEPVAWRDHVEQRLLTWRQSFVDKSGDQLALDDFMDKQSLDDLLEYVLDEYTTQQQQRKPLTVEQIWEAVKDLGEDSSWRHIVDAIEAAHGIKE